MRFMATAKAGKALKIDAPMNKPPPTTDKEIGSYLTTFFKSKQPREMFHPDGIIILSYLYSYYIFRRIRGRR